MDFPEPLRTQVREKLNEERQREKNKKAVLQTTAKMEGEMRFDSEGEAEYYHCFLRPRELAGEICMIRQQVRYELLPDFKSSDGRQVQGMHYTADFVYTEVATGIEVTVEVKARKRAEVKVKADGNTRRRRRSVTDTEASKLRWKLLQYIYRNDKTKRFVKWFRGEKYE